MFSSPNYFKVIEDKKVKVNFYKCDKNFHVDIVKRLLQPKHCIGLLSIDSSEACLAVMDEGGYREVQTLTSGVPGKTSKGGSSQARYQRDRENDLKGYYARVAKALKSEFVDKKIFELVIGGPIPTKEKFLKQKHIDYRLKVLARVDGAYAGAEGVRELFNRILAMGLIDGLHYAQAKKKFDIFLKEIDSGLAIYGPEVLSLANQCNIILATHDIGIPDCIEVNRDTELGAMIESFGGIVGVKKY